MRTKYAILFLILTFNLVALACPYLKSYTKRDYPAASQNWAVAKDQNGNMYFGNNSGLLEFDGVTWTLYQLPEGEIVRAVAVDNENRIYTAGYRELGCWKRNENGRIEYQSLKHEVESYFSANEEIWDIICFNNHIYFQSFSKIYVYYNDKFEVINPGGFINSISNVGGQILVNVMNIGIYSIAGTNLSPFCLNNLFDNKEIRFVLPLSNSEKLIGINSGLLLFDGKRLREWNISQGEYFRKNIVNRGSITADGKIVVGTILDGVSIFDREGTLLYRFNKENGLQNNTVLDILSESDDSFWLALDNGIEFLSFSSDPSYAIIERKELGTVYSAAVYQSKIYLGTNQGLYSRAFSSSNEPFTLIPGTQGQIWECKVFDDRLFVSHNKGTFEIFGDEVHFFPGSGGFSITNDPLNPNKLIQSTYSNLVFFKKSNSGWQISKISYEINDLIRHLEVDHLGNYWGSHLYHGILRFKFALNDSLIYSRLYGKEIFNKDHNVNVFKVENRIVFTTGEKLYTYDDLKDTIVEHSALNEKLGEFGKASKIISCPENCYWFITDSAFGLFRILDKEIIKLKEYPTELFAKQLVTGFENIIPLSSKTAILCLENGYAILNADKICLASQISNARLELKRLTNTTEKGQLIELPVKTQEIVIRYNQNNLQLRYSFPFFNCANVVFQSFVSGLDQHWSETVEKPVFNFKRIPVGKYCIKIRAINSWGEPSLESVINLNVLPPWYRSNLAYCSYLLLIIVGLLGFRRGIILRTQKKESLERKEKERELTELRNAKLQTELLFKSSELANSTMAIIKKNEFLMEIKDTLRHQKDMLGNRYPDKYFDTVMQKINYNMTSQEEWKAFESNFNRAHEQFMKTLTDNYSDLTSSDLRLSAFLRMNLSSKEIAPLLGITVRSVENHRYRLRKKLELDADSNLTDFIIRL